MRQFLLLFIILSNAKLSQAQLRWKDVSARFGPLAEGIQVFYTNDSLDGKPFIGYYVQAAIKNRQLDFSTQVGNGRRYRPSAYYTQEDSPQVVVNATFFNFDKNQNLNLVVQEGNMVAYNVPFIKGMGKDSGQQVKPFRSAIGISKKRKADIAWIYADTALKYPRASQQPVWPQPRNAEGKYADKGFKKWKMQTAIGGGPVLVQNGKVMVTNEEEMLFAGKGLYDKHPRTAIGYTADGRLIVLAVQGRFPGIAEGASLLEEANILVSLGCTEALNVDGGGSSCLLVNGMETIRPSDKEGQRPVPGVFIIRSKD